MRSVHSFGEIHSAIAKRMGDCADDRFAKVWASSSLWHQSLDCVAALSFRQKNPACAGDFCDQPSLVPTGLRRERGSLAVTISCSNWSRHCRSPESVEPTDEAFQSCSTLSAIV